MMSKRFGVIALILAGVTFAPAILAQDGAEPGSQGEPEPIQPAGTVEPEAVEPEVGPPQMEEGAALAEAEAREPQAVEPPAEAGDPESVISENLDLALANYEDLLEKAPEEARRVIRERIAANEILLARYRTGLDRSNEQLRVLKIESASQGARKTRPSTQFAADQEYAMAAATSDVKFFQVEVAATEERLARLRAWAAEHGIVLEPARVVVVEKEKPREVVPAAEVPAPRPAPPTRPRIVTEVETQPELVRETRPETAPRMRTSYRCATCGQVVVEEREVRWERRAAATRRASPPHEMHYYQYYGTCPPPPPPCGYTEWRWR